KLIQEKPHLGRMWLVAFKQPPISYPLTRTFDQDFLKLARIFVYEYLDDNFLSLVHVKPDNILVNYRNLNEEAVIEKVQISDLENAAYLLEPRCIKGMLAGNDNWRSPEGHFKGELNKPSDLHLFGLVCIYAVLGRVILGPDDDFKLHELKGALPAFIRLQRQILYFGDKEGLNVLMKDVGDKEANCEILRMLWEDWALDYIPYVPILLLDRS
ncbi:hypothetical protein IAQ61_010263, partial [Plenodomus lingam]|uniref:uncharacterized protein n=1 Tax=Leptosphaeria maculans TaxID=5022 RepID=UPI00332C01AE